MSTCVHTFYQDVFQLLKLLFSRILLLSNQTKSSETHSGEKRAFLPHRKIFRENNSLVTSHCGKVLWFLRNNQHFFVKSTFLLKSWFHEFFSAWSHNFLTWCFTNLISRKIWVDEKFTNFHTTNVQSIWWLFFNSYLSDMIHMLSIIHSEEQKTQTGPNGSKGH